MQRYDDICEQTEETFSFSKYWLTHCVGNIHCKKEYYFTDQERFTE